MRLFAPTLFGACLDLGFGRVRSSPNSLSLILVRIESSDKVFASHSDSHSSGRGVTAACLRRILCADALACDCSKNVQSGFVFTHDIGKARRLRKVLHIIKYPHPVLRFDSSPVRTIDDELRTRVRAMFDLMYENRGVGLAANQVGLPYRFFILNVTSDPSRKESELVFINPEIIKRHSTMTGEEGCLSFPGLYGEVPRAKRIRVRAFDITGNEFIQDADELLGRAIQHENDHLSGKLFIDYFSSQVLKQATPKLQEFEAEFREAQRSSHYPTDELIRRELQQLAQTS
jgi:peptide deformylase